MTLLIDGHNLIPHIPGLSLSDPDDENKLIALLQTYCRIKRRRVEVFFDQAPPGHAGTHQAGSVKVHNVPRGKTADSAILHRLRNLGKTAPNWKVVSSDHAVMDGTRHVGSEPILSQTFSRELVEALSMPPSEPSEDRPMDEDELAGWMDLFTRGRN